MSSTVNYFDSPDIDHIISSLPTPVFITDAQILRRQVQHLVAVLPYVTFFYSIKTNPHPLVIDTLREFPEMQFDAATTQEIDLVLGRGVKPDEIMYTHPVKSPDEIEYAYSKGIRVFTFDCLDELRRLEQHAPEGMYLLRLVPAYNSSLYDYKRKFGAMPGDVSEILEAALATHANVGGISFMVGSQSMSSQAWRAALEQSEAIFDKYYDKMPNLRTLNIGSGFPLQYGFSEEVPSLENISEVIQEFRDRLPEDISFIGEPGRIIVGPATVLVTEVFQRIDRSQDKWLYIDANAYSGPIEIIESSGTLPYPISSRRTGDLTPFVVAGKTLDPDDIFSKSALLSTRTQAGDLLMIHDMGAYTHTFFTDYHSLPQPLIYIVDSQYDENVELAIGGMEITGIRARRNIAPGEKLFEVTGYFYPERTRTTFQVDKDRHIEPTQFGAFLNHSCDPNAGVRTNKLGHYDVVARRTIRAGEEITADYAMFEYQTGPMSKVSCLCGSPSCRTLITGYIDLPDERKKEYAGFIADYLVAIPQKIPKQKLRTS